MLSPLVQKRQISMPPALILVAQVLMGVVAGFLGIAVATPLVAVAMVTIGVLYIEDYLDEERTVEQVPGIDGPPRNDTRSDADRYREWQDENAAHAEPPQRVLAPR